MDYAFSQEVEHSDEGMSSMESSKEEILDRDLPPFVPPSFSGESLFLPPIHVSSLAMVKKYASRTFGGVSPRLMLLIRNCFALPIQKHYGGGCSLP